MYTIYELKYLIIDLNNMVPTVWILALKRLRREVDEFEVFLGYTETHPIKKKGKETDNIIDETFVKFHNKT